MALSLRSMARTGFFHGGRHSRDPPGMLDALERIDPSLHRLRESYDAGYYALEALARELERYGAWSRCGPCASRARAPSARCALWAHQEIRVDDRRGDRGRSTRRSLELDLLDSASLDLNSLRTRETEALGRLEAASGTLSRLRRQGATRLGAAVGEILPDLGMPDGKFIAVLDPLPEIGAHGTEGNEFLVSLNIGHEARPLARVASGGELSRVMLALKTILAKLDRVPTLVFDEVDSGIGGRVGLQVGDTMRRVAGSHQVFAISHLPQIASRAHHHIVVSKGARGGVTTADVSVVTDEDRVTEIARMLGGDPESGASLAHARELLEHAAVKPAGRGQRRVPR